MTALDELVADGVLRALTTVRPQLVEILRALVRDGASDAEILHRCEAVSPTKSSHELLDFVATVLGPIRLAETVRLEREVLRDEAADLAVERSMEPGRATDSPWLASRRRNGPQLNSHL